MKILKIGFLAITGITLAIGPAHGASKGKGAGEDGPFFKETCKSNRIVIRRMK